MSQDGVNGGQWDRNSPTKDVKPFEYLIFRDESYDQQSVQVKALTEHPEVVANHEMMDKYVKQLTPDLKR